MITDRHFPWGNYHAGGNCRIHDLFGGAWISRICNAFFTESILGTQISEYVRQILAQNTGICYAFFSMKYSQEYFQVTIFNGMIISNYRYRIVFAGRMNFHYGERSVGITAENLSLQIQILSWIPIKIHYRYRLRAQKELILLLATTIPCRNLMLTFLVDRTAYSNANFTISLVRPKSNFVQIAKQVWKVPHCGGVATDVRIRRGISSKDAGLLRVLLSLSSFNGQFRECPKRPARESELVLKVNRETPLIGLIFLSSLPLLSTPDHWIFTRGNRTQGSRSYSTVLRMVKLARFLRVAGIMRLFRVVRAASCCCFSDTERRASMDTNHHMLSRVALTMQHLVGSGSSGIGSSNFLEEIVN